MDEIASINLLIIKIINIKHFTNFFYLHRFVDNGMISPSSGKLHGKDLTLKKLHKKIINLK